MKACIRNRTALLYSTLSLVALMFALVLIARNDFLTNVGFLVLGALIAVWTTLLSEELKRPRQARDLARALYEELADRVARCCFDFEAPWQTYAVRPEGMGTFRLRKFSPEPPIVFPATAGQLALLGNEAPQALIRFYYCLAAWKRDLDNIALEVTESNEALHPDVIRFLAIRLRQTLAPGMRALEALAPMVDGYTQIEATAISGYDELRNQPTTQTLRDRIRTLITRGSADND